MLRAPKNKQSKSTRTLRGDGGGVGEMRREIETLNYKSKPDPQTLVNKLKKQGTEYLLKTELLAQEKIMK